MLSDSVLCLCVTVQIRFQTLICLEYFQAHQATPFARARHSSSMLIHVTAPNMCNAPTKSPFFKPVDRGLCGASHH